MRQVRSRHIYVIASSINECLVINQCLRQVGLEVSYALDGRKGVATVMAVPPQCLILDSVIPGINGYAILRQVRAAYPQSTLPIIIMSAQHSDLDRNYTFGLGANRYLEKPYTAQQLAQAVWDVIPASARQLAEAHQLTTLPLPVPERVGRQHVRTLVPFRQERAADILRGNNPFVSNADITDLHLRRLYAAIDNQRSVQILSTVLQLNLQTMLYLLGQLESQQHIALYDIEYDPPKRIDFARIRTYAQEEIS